MFQRILRKTIIFITAILYINSQDKLNPLVVIVCLGSVIHKVEDLQIVAPNNSILLQRNK
jgi:hypothetical protein